MLPLERKLEEEAAAQDERQDIENNRLEEVDEEKNGEGS